MECKIISLYLDTVLVKDSVNFAVRVWCLSVLCNRWELVPGVMILIPTVMCHRTVGVGHPCALVSHSMIYSRLTLFVGLHISFTHRKKVHTVTTVLHCSVIPLPICSHTCLIIQATSVHMQHLVATFILYHTESGSAVLSQFLELLIAVMV